MGEPMNPTYPLLRAYRAAIGEPWFTAPLDLNLFVVRSGTVGEWDDLIVIAYTDQDGQEVVESWPCTADAWIGEWTDPTHPDGCVYILDQHVAGGYAPGLHKGRLALRQVQPFRYVRWPTDATEAPSVDELVYRAEDGHSFEGNRGTHIHNRVSAREPRRPARDDSEGCVVTLRQRHMRSIRELVDEQAAAGHGDRVSPTFVSANDLEVLAELEGM